MAQQQAQELKDLLDGQLGGQLLLGGFSLAAWWAYAVAAALQQLGVEVKAVLLLDPVNTNLFPNRWRWRRWLADQ
jgi:thioesterase domain-containing protein